MKSKAVRIYGKRDLRLEEFDLPPMKEDEILARVVSDSICMSTHKAALQGIEHKRIPNDVHKNPTIVGHEFSGEIIAVGEKWADQFQSGQKFSIQPALNYKGSLDAPGYSYRWIGGNATHIIIPNEVMEMNCLLAYDGPGFYPASLSEPLSCVIGAFHANYHMKPGKYNHHMDIQEKGNMAILAGAGPMGLAAINYALYRERKPSLLVVTDIDDQRLNKAELLYSKELASKMGVELVYMNTGKSRVADKDLLNLAGGEGFNDVFVFAPVPEVIELGDKILARDGCLNFFAGPSNPDFSAKFNFYNLHYNSTHVVGTSGGNNDDMNEALELMAKGLDPSGLITHIGGLNAVIDTTLNLPGIPGGKKLIYTNINLELTAIDDFEQLGENNPLFKSLAEITSRHNGLWSVEAEAFLLKNVSKLS
ncbi:MAG: zinc-binding dehydrogenase [Bacteroidales bacterium]|nr:zinc-binding dehydrogenase [Bacteroidales bacterium]